MSFAVVRRAVVLLFLLGGCRGPDLGEAPFFCHTGDPPCPEGYVCQGKICARATTSQIDARLVADTTSSTGSDSESLADGRLLIADRPPRTLDQNRVADQKRTPDQKIAADQPASAPQVQISEFLANPWTVVDTDGEWLELHNLGSLPVDINGWMLKDKGIDYHVINAGGSLLIPAKGYLVLGRTVDKLKNGGAAVQYAYGSSFSLSNSADEIVLLSKSGAVIDSISYSTGSGWYIPDGGSLSLKKTATANHNDPNNWCAEPKPWPGSAGDYGTPGGPPGC